MFMGSQHCTEFKLRPQPEGRPILKKRRCQEEGVVERNCYGPTITPNPHPPTLLSIGRDKLAMG